MVLVWILIVVIALTIIAWSIYIPIRPIIGRIFFEVAFYWIQSAVGYLPDARSIQIGVAYRPSQDIMTQDIELQFLASEIGEAIERLVKKDFDLRQQSESPGLSYIHSHAVGLGDLLYSAHKIVCKA